MQRFRKVAVGLALAAVACSDGSNGGSGRTRVYLTDDPFPFDSIARVDVYVARIEAAPTLDTSQAGGQGWVTVAEPRQAFNLLDFQQGATALAGEADIPAGQYRAIRLTINTTLSHVIRKDNSEVPVHWPVAGELALNAWVENALDVPAGGAQIVIDFDVGRTFVPDSSGGFFFVPWIRAVNDAATGSIAGTVTGPDVEGRQTPVPNAVVVVMTAPGMGVMPAMVSTGRTDDAGRYVIGYLAPGAYGIGVQAPRAWAFNSGNAGVEVAARARTVANFVLTRDTTGGSGGGTDTSTVTPGGPVASVALRIGTPSGSSQVNTCDSIPLSAELRNAQGQILLGRAVAWRSSDSTVLAVQGAFGQYAVLKALASGRSTLSATSEGVTAAITFTVLGPTCGGGTGSGAPVATVTLNPAALNIRVGFDSNAVQAVLRANDGTQLFNRQVSWSVADTTIAWVSPTVGATVLVKARRSGTTTVTATSEGKSGSAAVTVQ